jgi:hypothetical protein
MYQPLFTAITAAMVVVATTALAAELKVLPPVKPKELSVHVNQPRCAFWTDECVNCSRGADGGAPICSNIGFACQPSAIRCLGPIN